MNTANKYLVSVQGDDIVLLNPPRAGERISREDALTLAAWLVVGAQPKRGEFNAVLRAVRNPDAND